MNKLYASATGRTETKDFTFSSFFEVDSTINQSEQSMIFTHTYVQTGIVDSTSLADDDVTGFG